MKTTPFPARIAEMAALTRMERGHLSVIRTGPDGQPYPNAWFAGKGLVFLTTITHDSAASSTK